MKRALRRWAISLLAAICLSAYFFPVYTSDVPAGAEAAEVLYVYDGDTLKVRLEDGREVRVRLLGIDAPETRKDKYGEAGEPFADEAQEALVALARDKTVYLEYDERRTDQYGRTLAYVWLDGRLVNERLLDEGLAKSLFYRPNLRYKEQFQEREVRARQAKRGIWGKK